MSVEPADLDRIQRYLMGVTGLPAVALGIVGDSAHTGGYHCGNDRLRQLGRLTSDYSKAESPRDRPGSDAASALDIGSFSRVVGGREVTLRSLSLGLVAACRRNDWRARDIREIIYSPGGTTVKRWDRLGLRSTGDTSHRHHTHLSFHRDAEGRRDRADNALGLIVEIMEGTTDMTPEQTAELFRRLEVIDNATRAVAGCEPVVEYRGAAGDTWRMPNRLLERIDALVARPVVAPTDEQMAGVTAAVLAALPGIVRAELVAALDDTRLRVGE